MTRVAVVGGGITGLAAAWELLGAGAEVTVLEASDRLGGKILTDEIGGRPVDLGPDAFVARTPEALQLCRELGLVDELVRAATDQAAVWLRGKLRPLPHDVVLGVPSRLTSVARSRILSPVGVARAALDAVLPGRGLSQDRSVGDLVTARLGREVHDRLVDPLFGGIHAGPAGGLSVQATAPQLATAADTRSLVRGVRSQRRANAAEKPAFHSLRGGLGRLVERLEEELRAGGATIELGTAVKSLPVEGADATLATTPAPVTADLVAAASPRAEAELRAIDYASVAVTVLVYPASAFPRPPAGSGFLVPHREGRLMTACSFASSKWPHWAAPDEVVLRVSAGRCGDQRALEMGDVEIVQGIHSEVVDALGLTAAPIRARVTRWLDAFPQYRVGHLERVERIEAALEQDLPGVRVAGAAYRGLGITTCITQGRGAARRVLERARAERSVAGPLVSEDGDVEGELDGEDLDGGGEAEAEAEAELTLAGADGTSWPRVTGTAPPPEHEDDGPGQDEGGDDGAP